MAAIDCEIDRFFNHMASIRWKISDIEDWCRKYEGFNYPKWTTKEGKEIALGEMSDTHLTNTIAMLERKEPNSGWCKALKQERQYRVYKEKLNALRQELNNMEEVADTIF